MLQNGQLEQCLILMADSQHNKMEDSMEYTLVTGASSGVGKEVAIYLSKNRNIILHGRNMNKLLETQKECKNNTIIWNYDLSNIDNIEKELSSFIEKNEIKVDSFVHCAGMMKMIPIRSVSLELLNNTYSVNVFAPMMITKTLASKRVNGQNLKSVVFISSNISNRGAAAFSVYGSSKSALDGLMRNLSIELAPNIRINSILPGAMITEMTKEIFSDDDKKAEFEKNYPLGIGTVLDISGAVEFLLSDNSRWITGQQVTIDGGRTINITERSN